jgi:predicted metal-dependent HD superfamily phosphohydrolase
MTREATMYKLPVSTMTDILARYSEPRRRYHTLNHVNKMFKTAERLVKVLDEAQILAVVLHDIVYDIPAPAGENERKSASYFEKLLLSGEIAMERKEADRISASILDTATALSPDYQSIKDWTVPGLDLYSLGVTYEYWQNRQLVMEEYCMVLGSKDWNDGRRKFLTGLKSREYVIGRSFFNTDEAYRDWHDTMRKNVEQELLTLR